MSYCWKTMKKIPTPVRQVLMLMILERLNWRPVSQAAASMVPVMVN